jgi:hypothetical protein
MGIINAHGVQWCFACLLRGKKIAEAKAEDFHPFMFGDPHDDVEDILPEVRRRIERQGWYITTAFTLESLTKEDWAKTCCQLMRDKAIADLPWFEGEQ